MPNQESYDHRGGWPVIQALLAISTIFTAHSVPAVNVSVDTVPTSQACAALVSLDSLPLNTILVSERVNNGDVNADGRISPADIIHLVRFIFSDGIPPPSPFVAQSAFTRKPDGTWDVNVVFCDSVAQR
jgi:hypothetical protein